MLILYLFFVLSNSVSSLVLADDKLQAAKSNLQDLSLLFWSADKNMSKLFLSLDSIVKSYKNGNNIIVKNEGDIVSLMNYLESNRNILDKFDLSQYQESFDFLIDLLKYKDDVFDLLAKNQEQKYLIILQNANEVRPNGGFFGSFVLLSINQGKTDFKIIDSYYIDYVNSGVSLTIPKWANNFLDDDKIGFVAGNKFGFSDMDGNNLKILYEKVFTGDNIRGVFFIRSDFFENIIPGFKEKLWEWQFSNASVDLIRGENLPNKKQYYIKQLNNYFQENKLMIFKSLLSNFSDLKNKSNLSIYLTGIDQGLLDYLDQQNLTNTYNDDYLYFWDYNRGYNKVDGFVEKSILIEDLSGNVLLNPKGNIVDIKDLGKGKYKIYVYYDLVIPVCYDDFLNAMEKKYNIKLNYRERYILGQETIWDNEGLIYMPQQFKIMSIKGDSDSIHTFKTPFSKNISYNLKSDKKTDMKYLVIDVIKE